MRKTLTLLVASTALTAVIGTTAWSAMNAAPDGNPRPFAAIWQDAAQSLPLILASDDDDDDDENRDTRRDHDDDDDDEDCDDGDDDDCRGGAPNPAPAGALAPPQNGLFGNSAPPQVQVN